MSVCAVHLGIAAADDDEKENVLRLLQIMNGDENGDMHFDDPVTRAEFVKMAVCASPRKDAVSAVSATAVGSGSAAV